MVAGGAGAAKSGRPIPAIFNPDGDPDETLELAESEKTMLEAIDRLQRAIDKARPHPGRLRWLSVGGVVAAVLAVMLLWLPGALQSHVVSVVPEVKRQEIGDAILKRIERVCRGVPVPHAMRRRHWIGWRNGPACGRSSSCLRVCRTASACRAALFCLSRSLVEDHEDPAVAAGYVIAERARSEQQDPLDDLLDRTGASSAFRLLTTGGLTPQIVDSYTEQVLSEPRPSVTDEALLAMFAQAALPSTPYAYARDITGETVLGLIEADPMAGRTLEQVLPDRDWVRLQNICGE